MPGEIEPFLLPIICQRVPLKLCHLGPATRHLGEEDDGGEEKGEAACAHFESHHLNVARYFICFIFARKRQKSNLSVLRTPHHPHNLI